MRVLSKRQVLMLHAALIAESGGCDGIRDEGLLDSAINTPLQTFESKDLYPTVLEKAARLGFGLIRNHPFLTATKELEPMQCWYFLQSTASLSHTRMMI